MAIEQTLVLVKPDGAKRRLTGIVIDRLEAEGLTLAGAKVACVTEELARAHYRQLEGRPFFEDLIKYIRGLAHDIPDNRILAVVYEGEDAISRVRRVAGVTNPEEAAPGSIRGSFGRISTSGHMENVLHASGNAADAEHEIKLWFSPGEIVNPLFPSKKEAVGAGTEALIWA